MTYKSDEEKFIEEVTNRFLCWKLPEDFSPDGGISFQKVHSENSSWGPIRYEPVGTNLFTASQTKEMLRQILGDSLGTFRYQDKSLYREKMKDAYNIGYEDGSGRKAPKTLADIEALQESPIEDKANI